MQISQMEQEAREVPQIVKKQFAMNQSTLQSLCERLKSNPPAFAMTIARGSSDHAATFAKYVLETQLGCVTASAAPSVVTLYQANLHLKNSLVIGLSQSGQSPDIAETIAAARRAGAVTVAIVNQVESPLAEVAEYVVPLWAGPELAVAATKSYLGILSVLVHFVALFTQEPALLNALHELPERLQQAAQMDWSPAIAEYHARHNTFVVGRGYGFPIAQEAALKFKETSQIHAEAFSSAELLHGPFALVQKFFPLLVLAQRDVSFPGIIELSKRMHQMGATVMLATPHHAESASQLTDAASILLPLPGALHPLCDPLMIAQAFYVMIAKLAVARGFNPDAPVGLSKVTKTW
jgi:glucosamine--fructose-6-phosphate aminotransferase (isomerizing)